MICVCICADKESERGCEVFVSAAQYIQKNICMLFCFYLSSVMFLLSVLRFIFSFSYILES